ncbi:MAG: sulfurtransferase TusA family protein [Chloroflexi bacterium]|nr:sulfurtransferase TusA family protein [Chloroflexota bacterium]
MDEKQNGLLDLRGVSCPMNWVRTKMVLEDMEIGEKLEVWLDDGEPIRNVPRSIKDEGHKLLKVSPVEDYFRVVIERG